MLDNYDKIYPERNIPPEVDQENFQIKYIRECIFEKLLPFIKPAYQVINTNSEKPRKMQDYWDQKKYLKLVEEQNDIDPEKTYEYVQFAKRLCLTQSFCDFIDGYLEEKLMNFDLVNSILCHRGELKQRYKQKSSTFAKFDQTLRQKMEGLSSQQRQDLTNKFKASLNLQNTDPRFFFNDEVVTFNYKIPSFRQRQMLFEKIRYLVDAHFNEKENIFKSSIIRKTNKSQENNKVLENLNQHKKMSFYFKKIIALVRQVYDDVIAESKTKKQPLSINQSLIQEQDNVSELGDKVESLHNNRDYKQDQNRKIETPRWNPNLQAQRGGSIRTSEQDILWAKNILQRALENKKEQIESQGYRKSSTFGSKSLQLRNQHTSFGIKKEGDPQVSNEFIDKEGNNQQQIPDQKTPLQDSTMRRLKEPEQPQNLNDNLEQSQIIDKNLLLLSQVSQFLILKGERQSLQIPTNFNQSLRGTESNVTCNFGAKQENERFSTIMGLPQQINTIMLSSLGNDKEQKEIKQAIDVLQQSIKNDRRVTMYQVQGPEQQNLISLDQDEKKDSDNNSESQISNSTQRQRDKIYQLGQKSIQGSIRSRDVSPNSIPKPQVEEYKEQSDSQLMEMGESNFNHLSHLSKKNQQTTQQHQMSFNLSKKQQLEQQAKTIEWSSSEMIKSEFIEETPTFPIGQQEQNRTANTHDASDSKNYLDQFKKPLLIMNQNNETSKQQRVKNIQIQSLELNKNQFSKMIIGNTNEDQGSQTFVRDDQTNFTGYGQAVDANEEAKLQAYVKNRKGSVDSKKLGGEKGSLIYGKRGMLNFMENLFVYLTEQDKSKLNFYFTIRESIIEFIDLRQQYNEQLMRGINQNESLNIDDSSQEFKDLSPYEPVSQSPQTENEILSPKLEQNFYHSKTQNMQIKQQRKMSYGMERKQSLMSDKNKNNIKSNSYNSITPQVIIPCPNGQLCQPNRMKSIIMRDFCQSNRTDAATPGGQVVHKIYTTSMLFKSQMTQIQKYQQSSRKSSWSYTQVQGSSPIKNQMEQSNQLVIQSIENISNQQMSQKEILEQQYAQVQDTHWFWTENDASYSEFGESGTESPPKSIFQSITYQEILFFIKLVRTFEDPKNVGSMLLQLIINFPLVWKILPKDNICPQAPSGNGFDFKDVLEYMIPLDRLTATLDNMCRQQIIDLYQILDSQRLQRASQKSLASEHSKQVQTKFIPQVTHGEYCLKMPSDYCSNELLTQQSTTTIFNPLALESPIYKDLIKLLVHEVYRDKMDEIKEEERVLDTKTSELFIDYQGKRSKRDLSDSGRYEIVDERIFLECSVYRILIVDQIKASIQKSKELFQRQQEEEQREVEEEQKRMDESNMFSIDFLNNTCKDPYVAKMLKDEERKEKKLKKKMSKLKRKLTSKSGKNEARSASEDSDYYDKQADVRNKRTSLLDFTSFFFKQKSSNLNESKSSKKKRTGNQTARTSLDMPFALEAQASQQIPANQNFDLSSDLQQKDFDQIQQTRERQKYQQRQSDVIPEEFFKQQLESYISDSRPQRIVDKQFKRVKNPICVSIQLLEKIVSFWTKDFNQKWLAKFKSSSPEEKQKRLDYLHKVLKKIQSFEFFEPVFEQTELCDSIQRPMQIDQFQEYSKQCFYLNIYNALILFKIAEIGTIKGSYLSTFVNHNSWVALEQNVHININRQVFTAYQIKHEVIKNVRNSPPSAYCVNKAEVHPLIDYAFFCPRGGCLSLESLCFSNVTCLDYHLQRDVNKYLDNKIVFNPDFSLIFLPESLKACLKTHEQKVPNINIQTHCDQSYQSKQRLRVISQQQKVLSTLEFIRENILPNDDHLYSIVTKIRLQLTTLIDGKSDYKDAKEFVIEYQTHSQNFKKEKIVNGNGLIKYHKDILKKEAEKAIQYEETVVVEERSSESGSSHHI